MLTSPEPEGRLPQGSVTLAHFVYCLAWCCHIGSCHFSFTPISMIYNAGWVTLPSKLFLSHYFVCPALGLSGIYVSRQVYFSMFSDIILSFIRLKCLNFLTMFSKSQMHSIGYSISFLITVCNVLQDFYSSHNFMFEVSLSVMCQKHH